MVNSSLFNTQAARVPLADDTNDAGGRAYAHGPEHALAQLAATGCLSDTFYANASQQLDRVLETAAKCNDDWIARVAVYARERGLMKDMPALLAARLAVTSPDTFRQVAPRVLTNGRMVRTFVRILRSGQLGRKSIPRCARTYIRGWIRGRSSEQLFRESVGTSPSLADVIKMVHVKPRDEAQDALLGYLIGSDAKHESLPGIVRQFERFKREGGEVPNVEFRLLTALDLTKDQWVHVAAQAPWHALRMNLNTFARHGVWESKDAVKHAADRLRDETAIRRVGVMPYQLFAAYKHADPDVPQPLRLAVQDAMEIATRNVPKLDGEVTVVVDVSASMQGGITGGRGRGSSKMRCIDVAGLVAACIVRANPEQADVIAVDTSVYRVAINPRDSVVTIADGLSRFNGGGTALGAAIDYLGREGDPQSLIWIVSDNESWADGTYWRRGSGISEQMGRHRNKFKRTRFVMHDIQPGTNTQAPERPNTLNVGGFSDAVFDVVSGWSGGRTWVDQIKEIALQ